MFGHVFFGIFHIYGCFYQLTVNAELTFAGFTIPAIESHSE